MNNNVNMSVGGKIKAPFAVYDGGASANGAFAVSTGGIQGIITIDASEVGNPELEVTPNQVNCAGTSLFLLGSAALGSTIFRLLTVAPEIDFGATGAVAGVIKAGGLTIKSGAGSPVLNLDTAGGTLKINNVQVVKAGIAGWGTPTTGLNRLTFDTATVTLPQLAQRVGQLIVDLLSHGLLTA